MSVGTVVAIAAVLTAVVALLLSIRVGQRLHATRVELMSAMAMLDRERQLTAESIAAVHRSTVEDVTTLIENLLVQVDTEITAKVAEALVLLNSRPGSNVREVDRSGSGADVHARGEPTT